MQRTKRVGVTGSGRRCHVTLQVIRAAARPTNCCVPLVRCCVRFQRKRTYDAHTLIDLKLTLNAEVQDGSGVPRYFGHIHPALAKRLGTSTLLRSDHHLHVLATCRHQDGLPLPEAADQTCTLFEQTLADSGWQMSVSPYSWDSAAYTIMLSGSRYVQSTWRWKRA